MNENIRVIEENYNKSIWQDSVLKNFYELQDSPTKEFFPLLLKIVTEKRGDKFLDTSLRTLDYYQSILTDSEIDSVKDALRQIIEDEGCSLEIHKQAIAQLGYLGTWPDIVLRNIIEKSTERELKVFAFRAVLTQLKLPYQVIDLETTLAIDGEIEPDFNRINLVTQARADGHFDHLV